MANKETDVKQQGKKPFPKGKQKTIKKQGKTKAEKVKKQRQTSAKINTARSEKEKALVKEYNKQRSRLKAAVKRAEKRGYSFSDFIPGPKYVVTKSEVERLKRIKGQDFYKYGKYYDLKQHKYISGIERKKQEQKISARKAAETRKRNKNKVYGGPDEVDNKVYGGPDEVYDVLQYLFELVAGWSPDIRWSDSFSEVKNRDKNIMANIIKGAINDIGKQQVARNCQAHAAEIKELAWYICYGYSGSDRDRNTNADIVKLSTIIRGRSLTPDESKELQDIADSLAYETTEE